MSGDLYGLYRDENLFVSELLIALTLWAVVGSALHYTTNLCSMKNSPLAIGIAHSFKVYIDNPPLLKKTIIGYLQYDTFHNVVQGRLDHRIYANWISHIISWINFVYISEIL